MNKEQISELVCQAILDSLDDKSIVPTVGHRLVDDLGFDSLRIANLSITLEEAFGHVILLNDWLSDAYDPRELTVRSLVDYIQTNLGPA